jgi:hypothetical protein
MKYVGVTDPLPVLFVLLRSSLPCLVSLHPVFGITDSAQPVSVEQLSAASSNESHADIVRRCEKQQLLTSLSAVAAARGAACVMQLACTLWEH